MAPEFAERAGEVVVRFFPSRYVPPTRITCDLTQLQQEILAVLAERGSASAVELNERLAGEQTTRSVLHHLKHLQNLGLVDKHGVTRGAAWRLKGVEPPKKKRGRPRKPRPEPERREAPKPEAEPESETPSGQEGLRIRKIPSEPLSESEAESRRKGRNDRKIRDLENSLSEFPNSLPNRAGEGA